MSMAPLKKLAQIQFGILSPSHIRKMSTVQITVPDTFDEEGLPIPGGLMDTRLGAGEPGQRCEVCGNPFGTCPGHFGHIELARPVIHIGYVKHIHKVLKCTCFNCGRILLPEEKIKEYLEKLRKRKERSLRLAVKLVNKIVKEASSTSTCPHCKEKQPKVIFEKPTLFYIERKPKIKEKLTPMDIRAWLEKIPDTDCELLGFDPENARPEWMVLTVLPVPPVVIRASVTLETGVKSEDDLTHKLGDIVRTNERLKNCLETGAPNIIIEDLWDLLQYHVTTYFDNEASGVSPSKHRSGRPLKTLAQRLKGKEGRFRSNLSGKRVDFSARTVISPDPSLSINEVGVPESIAKVLTVPEKVTPWNIEEMRKLVERGPFEHPGANYVIRPDGRKIDLRYRKDRKSLAEALEPGYVVERHLRDGDIVLFNRQPSLHRMSMMAHVVRVLPTRTFTLNLCVCPPYNADFDGDEMNLHVPQTEEARAEAKVLMLVQEQILSPRYGGPIIGAIHDYITGAYLLTRKETLLRKDEVLQLLYYVGYDGELPPPKVKEPEPMWTGKQIVSLFLPKDFNYSLRATTCRKCSECLGEKCPYDAYVLIRNGELVCGVFDKKAIGAQQAESVLHRIVKDYGADQARAFIDKLFKLFIHFLDMCGFSMSIRDTDVPEEAYRVVNANLRKAEEEVNKLIEAYRRGELERLPGLSLEESLETEILKRLSDARDTAGEVAAKYLSEENSAYIMAKTGARGNILNITQITACVGQQSVRGERIKRGYTNRTLSHFKKGDLGTKARGFVYNCYKTGLTPIEFFFHAMAGRDSLVDTAVRTSQSGYLQRRLINALQDLRVEYDLTVRTASGEIVQFKYGEDGIDPAKSDYHKSVNVDKVIERVLAERRS